MNRYIARFAAIVCILSVLLPAAGAGAAESAGTVLITGANRGLGYEFARQFSERGYHVIGTARSPGEAGVLDDLGVRVEQLDVADTGSVRAMARRLKGVPVDILINNAGIIGPRASSLSQLDVDALDKTWQVNSLGPMRVTRALLDNLEQGKAKKIINITSNLGSLTMNSGGGLYGYRMTKTALNMFTGTLAAELGGRGYICIVLHPGWVQTDMGGDNAPLTPAQSISGMITVIDGLTATDNGRFFDYRGKEMPW